MTNIDTHLPLLEVEEHSHSILEGVKRAIEKLGDILWQKMGPELYKFFIQTTIDACSQSLSDSQVEQIWTNHQFFWKTFGVGLQIKILWDSNVQERNRFSPSTLKNSQTHAGVEYRQQ